MSETTTRTRNPRGEGSRLREEIVSAATGLLQEGTIGDVTLRAVARRAGITAPSIYRHFPDVDSILWAVVDEAFVELEQRLRDALDPADPPSVRLQSVAHGYLAFAQERPERYRLMFGTPWARSDVPQNEAVDRSRLGLNAFAVLREVLEECVAAGVSASVDTYMDTTALWVGLHGLAGLRETTPSFPWPEGLREDLVRTLARIARG